MKEEQKFVFDGSMSVSDVADRLSSIGSNVKVKGKKVSCVFDNTRLVVSKKKDGYVADIDFPGYVFLILWALAGVVFFALNMKGLEPDALAYLIGNSLGKGLFVALILYLISALIYASTKKDVLQKFNEKAAKKKK